MRAYPRGRGGTDDQMEAYLGHKGLSPRARGNLHRDGSDAPAPGPIPAGAGEPGCLAVVWPSCRAYPRGRGGTWLSCCRLAKLPGLSPRARGNLSLLVLSLAPAGPIPAGAGEPHGRQGLGIPERAYPRGRGGTPPRLRGHAHIVGLSPRARGNHALAFIVRRLPGPIPAGAGEPLRG